MYGGYTTQIPYVINSGRTALDFSYLGDALIYDSTRNRWDFVYYEDMMDFPEHRAEAVLVIVPPLTAIGPFRSDGSGADGGGVNKVNRMLQGHRVFLLGGYNTLGGGPEPNGMPMDEVWELTISHNLKRVKGARCWGCGRTNDQVPDGLRSCKGSCGGAVIVCSKECQAKVWSEQGHKHWCRNI